MVVVDMFKVRKIMLTIMIIILIIVGSVSRVCALRVER